MRRAAAAALALGALLAAPRAAAAATPAQCGLPDAAPLWIDYSEGTVRFRDQIFRRPGVIAATTGTTVAATLRRGGAQTIDWEMNLQNFVGTPDAPADPASIQRIADGIFDRAAATSGCATPLVALNELLKPTTQSPWTGATVQYRADVLALVQQLAARGARSFLLVPSNPWTGSDEARSWWLQLAQVADVVRQVYLAAPRVVGEGAILGNRELRTKLRAAIASLTSIGIPPAKVGVMLGFQSGGIYGRVGLQPREQWLRYVKWSALAARQVASEVPIGSIWSWGWGTFVPGPDPDADKAVAACVYLWTRDPSLCEAPTAAGPAFDSNVTEGQILLPAGTRCMLGDASIAESDLDRLQGSTGGDRGLAFSAALARIALTERVPVSDAEVAQAEAAVIARAFAGSRAAYEAELRRRNASPARVRAALVQELQRRELATATPGASVLGTLLDEERRQLDSAICLGDVFPAPAAPPLAVGLRFLSSAPPPAAPTGLEAVAGEASVTLTWTLGADVGLAGYAVYRAGPDGVWSRLNGPPLAATTYVDTGLASGTTYRYVVRAVDTGGLEGHASAELAATPTAAVPSPAGPQPPPAAQSPAAVPDLVAGGSAAVRRARVGRAVAYLLSVSERAGAPAMGATLTVRLPAGERLLSAYAEGGSCAGRTRLVCSVGDLGARGRALVTIVVRPTRPGRLVLSATAATAAAERATANGARSWALTVPKPPSAPRKRR